MNDLITVEKFDLAKVFAEGKTKTIIDDIEQKAKDFVPDMTTEKGRDEIKSRAYAVSRSKTFIKKNSDRLKEDAQKLIRSVNSELSYVEKELDRVRDEVRQPVTEWEQAEQKRIDDEREEGIRLQNAEKERIAQAERDRQAQLQKEQEERQAKIEEEEAKQAEQRRLLAEQQAEIDAKNESIRLEQEEKQRKIDDELEKIEQSKKDQARKEEKLKLDIVINAVHNQINTIRKEKFIRVEHYQNFDLKELFSVDYYDEENSITAGAVASIKKIAESELAYQTESDKKKEEEKIKRDEEIKQQAVDEERKRREAQDAKEQAEKERQERFEKAEKEQKDHVDSIDNAVQESLRKFFGGSDEHAHDMLNFIKEGKADHVRIIY